MNDKRWPMYNRVLQQAQRMDDMLAVLGADPALAARLDEGAAFARARTVCLECPFEESCRRWLARGTGRSEPPSFCPNAAFFLAAKHSGPVIRPVQ